MLLNTKPVTSQTEHCLSYYIHLIFYLNVIQSNSLLKGIYYTIPDKFADLLLAHLLVFLEYYRFFWKEKKSWFSLS